MLSDGDASRLQRSLVQSQRLVIDVGAYLGTFGDPLEERDPSRLNITAHYSDSAATDRVIAAIDAEIERVATVGTEPGELDRVRTKFAATIFRELDQVLNRSLEFAKFELLFGNAGLLLELPGLLADITDADVRAAAARLDPASRAIVELIPGAAR